MVSNDAKKYCREVGKWLPCSRLQKKRILDDLRDSVAAYIDDNPDAEYQAIVERFGLPQVIAATYIEELDSRELLGNLRVKRRIVSIVSVVACLVVFIWLGITTVALISDTHQADGYYITHIDEGVEE